MCVIAISLTQLASLCRYVFWDLMLFGACDCPRRSWLSLSRISTWDPCSRTSSYSVSTRKVSVISLLCSVYVAFIGFRSCYLEPSFCTTLHRCTRWRTLRYCASWCPSLSSACVLSSPVQFFIASVYFGSEGKGMCRGVGTVGPTLPGTCSFLLIEWRSTSLRYVRNCASV